MTHGLLVLTMVKGTCAYNIHMNEKFYIIILLWFTKVEPFSDNYRILKGNGVL